jgi:hypothetical protein
MGHSVVGWMVSALTLDCINFEKYGGVDLAFSTTTRILYCLFWGFPHMSASLKVG